MPTTVNAAFGQFLHDTVNLNGEVTRSARLSRDWLISQIHGFENSVSGFPILFSAQDILYGSFARNTKIRPLDDIDLMICLHAQGAFYTEYLDRIEITVPDPSVRLHSFCTENSNILNSRRVINKFVSALQDVPQYEKADVKRSQEAATLKLRTYSWNFDIVPCFFTTPDLYGNTCYIIPNGTGHWKKTDPRKDADAVSFVSNAQDGNVLNPVRAMKFWNRRATAPCMPSYLLETMLITHYISKVRATTSSFVDLEIPDLLACIGRAVFNPVNDLKNIQGDLNNLSTEDRWKIQQRALTDHAKAIEARTAESNEDHKTSICKWGDIFGPSFPQYG